MSSEPKPARLDADRTAKPLTELVAHVTPGERVSPFSTSADGYRAVAAVPADFVPPVVKRIRIDIASDPDFTKKGFGRRLAELGGRYSECRGFAETRFLNVPATEEGLALAARIIGTFGPGGAFRNKNGAYTVVVTDVAYEGEAEEKGPGKEPGKRPEIHSFMSRSSVQHVKRGSDGSHWTTFVNLQKVLVTWQAAAVRWWETEGRQAWQAEEARKKERVEKERAAMPAQLEALVVRMVAAGYSGDEVRGIVEAVLAKPSGAVRA